MIGGIRLAESGTGTWIGVVMTGAGYSKTPLIRKLGIKEGYKILVIDPPAYYWSLLGDLPADVDTKAPTTRARLDFVHIFVREKRGLRRRLIALRKKIAPDGMVWVSWPKKASGAETDLDGNAVRNAGLRTGLVDVKVCAVDETWSGLKFVIPVADRD